MTLRVLALCRYSSLGASSRVRFLQYIPALQKIGIHVTISPLFNDSYLLSLYNSPSRLVSRINTLIPIITAYVKRAFTLIYNRRFDVVWIEKELFPYLPGFAESLLIRSSTPYVVDFDDAVFHNYDLNKSPIIRTLLRNKLKALLSTAHFVTVGNSYLAEQAIRNGARNVVIIPSTVDPSRYPLLDEPSGDDYRIGWIGSPSTSKYLNIIYDPLRNVAKKRKIVFVLIGAPHINISGVRVEQHRWSSETETHIIPSFHVGVMPVWDSPWERGKCGYKIIQYMACSRPVIASPVGPNANIVTPDVGLLANDADTWIEAIITLADNAPLRRRLGQAGRKKIERYFSTHIFTDHIARILSDTAIRG